MKKGDHLVSPRTGYEHHGLYIGDNEVIHYSGLSSQFDKGSVEVTTLENFKNGRSFYIESHIFELYNAEERIERAKSRLYENSYNVIFNNCEHFVNWCFGIGISHQVNDKVSRNISSGFEIFKALKSQVPSKPVTTNEIELISRVISQGASANKTIAEVTAVGAIASLSGSSVLAAALAAAGIAVAGNVAGDVVDTAVDVAGDVVGTAGDLVGDVVGTAGDLVVDLVGGTGELVGGAVDKVEELWDSFWY